MPNEYQRADHERRIHRLEEDNKKIFSSLDDIKKGQHSQDLVNQKMNFTLDSINRERELNKKRMKKVEKTLSK